MTVDLVLFVAIGLVAIVFALAVILHPHPVYSALALIVTLFQVAILFVLLEAQMIALLQVIVYAGAIMVLFLFVIMLLNLQREAEGPSLRWRGVVLATGGVLALELAIVFLATPVPAGKERELAEGYGTVTSVARSLFTTHVLAFELASILLLVAIVGAVVLAKRRRPGT